MDLQRIIPILIVTIAISIIDIYAFQAYKTAIGKTRKNKLYTYIYWAVSLISLLLVLTVIFLRVPDFLRTASILIFFTLNLCKLFTLPALILDDTRRFIVYLKYKGTLKTEKEKTRNTNSNDKISRSVFLAKAGIIGTMIPFAGVGYGIKSVYDYRVRNVKLVLPKLPPAFEGFKVGQISDIHSGSFYDKKAVSTGVDLLLEQRCDSIFFTGDLVNNKASEMREYEEVFSRVKAPMGVYSILGNHDYGDYVEWPSPKEKEANLDDLKLIHKNMGWNLMLNSHNILEKNGEKIAVIGVENWGMGRFPKYGRLDKATKDLDPEIPIKLLLSHDPSHWRHEVLNNYFDIDVTFSGHTHGMQFGVRSKHFQWSPVQYIYPEWAGIYKEGGRQLYVNVGYGFLGYPGRIGILPEITIFTLSKKA